VRKLQIAIDVDGVIADFTAGALRVIEEVTGRRYDPVDVTEFDFTKALGLSINESRDVMALIGSRRGFCASLAPYPHARQGVRRLRELGDVFCVTSPWDGSPWWREERETWLALHFGIDRVHHAVDKSVYAADVFVDDRSDHVRAWAAAWLRFWPPSRSSCAAVLWRTPHNASEAVPDGAHSIGSWDALYEVARKAAREMPIESQEVAT
jgi:5'(3')-deoxyribonucleotidase